MFLIFFKNNFNNPVPLMTMPRQMKTSNKIKIDDKMKKRLSFAVTLIRSVFRCNRAGAPCLCAAEEQSFLLCQHLHKHLHGPLKHLFLSCPEHWSFTATPWWWLEREKKGRDRVSGRSSPSSPVIMTPMALQSCDRPTDLRGWPGPRPAALNTTYRGDAAKLSSTDSSRCTAVK